MLREEAHHEVKGRAGCKVCPHHRVQKAGHGAYPWAFVESARKPHRGAVREEAKMQASMVIAKKAVGNICR